MPRTVEINLFTIHRRTIGKVLCIKSPDSAKVTCEALLEKVVSLWQFEKTARAMCIVKHPAANTHMMCFSRARRSGDPRERRSEVGRKVCQVQRSIHWPTLAVGVRLGFVLKFVPSCTCRFLMQGELGDIEKSALFRCAELEKESSAWALFCCIPKLEICVTLACVKVRDKKFDELFLHLMNVKPT